MKERTKRILPAILIGIVIILFVVFNLLGHVSKIFLLMGIILSPIFYVAPLLIIWAVVSGIYFLIDHPKEGLINIAAAIVLIIAGIVMFALAY
jgi:hypothetical protein